MKLLPLALLALGGGLLYSLYYTKPRFLGDRVHVGDEVIVPLSALLASGQASPEIAATINPLEQAVIKVTRTTTETVEGPIVGIITVDGRHVPAPPLPTAFAYPRSSVMAISRDGKPVKL
jgi:hypothetical protein